MWLHHGPAQHRQQFSSSSRPQPPCLLPLPHSAHQPVLPAPKGEFSCMYINLGPGLAAEPRIPRSHRPRSDLSVKVRGPQRGSAPSLGKCVSSLGQGPPSELQLKCQGHYRRMPLPPLPCREAQPATSLSRIPEPRSGTVLRTRYTGKRLSTKVSPSQGWRPPADSADVIKQQ